MAKINLLKKEVRELIAAGEVVERPASVVKELVENSIDAGATSVEVEILRNGLGLIRVTDDGSGIDRKEVATAFLRHATSKVTSVQDLGGISTLGFRGEALAAISAVSRVRLVTKTADAENATAYDISAGEEQRMEEIGAPNGTSIYVADLFYNTPARMKFLKSDVHEGNMAVAAAEQMALCYPEVTFRFLRDGKAVFSTPGDGDLYSAIFSLLPRDVTEEMLKILSGDGEVRVSGYISAPQKARASRSLQYVFVNRRFVKSKSISAAAEEACKSVLMQGRYPSFVLYVDLSLQDVDVNVHPAKTEVRFKNDRMVFLAVYTAVKTAILEYASDFSRQVSLSDSEKTLTRSFAETSNVRIGIEEEKKQQIENAASFLTFEAKEGFRENYEMVSLAQKPLIYRALPGTDETVLGKPEKEEERPAKDSGDPSFFAQYPGDHLRVVGELFGTYIVVQQGDMAIFIDKHAAHERILFEQFRSREENAEIARQILLEPIPVALSSDEKQVLLENVPAMKKIGFLVEDFGDREVAVREVPGYLPFDAIAASVVEVASILAEQRNVVMSNQLEWLLHSSACRAAIKAGHRTTAEEMVRLTSDILNNAIPKFCPHGRPVYFMVQRKDMEKRFGRT